MIRVKKRDRAQEKAQLSRNRCVYQGLICMDAGASEQVTAILNLGVHTPLRALWPLRSPLYKFTCSVLCLYIWGVQRPLKSGFASYIKITRDFGGKGTPLEGTPHTQGHVAMSGGIVIERSASLGDRPGRFLHTLSYRAAL